jgi:hypothetical protein
VNLPLSGGVADPSAVIISDDPETRIQQAKDFWLRNPGFVGVFPVLGALRGLLELVPFGHFINSSFTPTEYGYGQPMIDQMRWQIRSDRQPGNPWWMTVNKRLVGDGIRVEAYMRAGRSRELTTRNELAWMQYITLSDEVRKQAAGQAGRGAGLLKKLEVMFVWRPAARRAYWTAHDESIQAGKGESARVIHSLLPTQPGEAQFGSAWANTITLFRITNPPAAGHIANFMNTYLLPQTQPYDTAKATIWQRMFYTLITALDPSFPPR